MFSVVNMVASSDLLKLFKMLPNGNWPVLRDGVPYGEVYISGEDWDWRAYQWEVVYQDTVVHSSKKYEWCQLWIHGNARHEPHRITNGIRSYFCEWDTDHWSFLEE